MTDVWEISRRRKYSEDKDCFYSRSEFERSRDDSDRKENSRRQNLDPIMIATTCEDSKESYDIGLGW